MVFMFRNLQAIGNRALGRRAASSVDVARIDVTAFRGGEEISATYGLREIGPRDALPLVLEGRIGPLELTAVEGIGVKAKVERFGRSCLVIADLERGGEWDHSSLALAFRWPRGPDTLHSTALLLPDLIPRPVVPSAGGFDGFQPIISIAEEDPVGQIVTAGLGAQPDNGDDDRFDQLLRLVLLRTDGADADDLRRGIALFSPRQVARLTEPARERIAVRLQVYLAELQGLLGVRPLAHLAVIDGADSPRSGSLGSGVAMSQIETLGRSGPADATEVAYAFGRLSRLWLGGGVVLHGDQGAELEDAFASACMIWGLETQGYSPQPAALRSRKRLLKGRSDSKPGGWRHRLFGRTDLVMTLAASMYEGFRTSESFRRALQTLLSRSWGRRISSREFLTLLEMLTPDQG